MVEVCVLAQRDLEAKMATVPPPSIYADVNKYDYHSFTITALELVRCTSTKC